MRLHRTRIVGFAGMIALLFWAVGCSPSRVAFNGPPGAVMFVDNKPYHLPAVVELWRPAGNGQSNRYPVSLVFTTQSQEVRAKGFIDVYGYTESDIDKMSDNPCNLDEAELAKLLDGKTLVFKAQTSSRQPLYDLTLMKQ